MIIDSGAMSPTISGPVENLASPKVRKRTKSVDEMSRLLDEMIQDRVEGGQLIKGSRGSVRIASERRTVTLESTAVNMEA